MKQKKLVTFRLIMPNPENTANQNRAGGFSPSESFPSRTTTFIIDDDGEPIEREIRYSPGQKSIFVDEQTKIAKRGPKIQFIDGFKVLNPREKLLISYLRAAPWNMETEDKPEGKISHFLELDYDKIADDAYEFQRKAGEAEVQFWNLQSDATLLKALARKIGANLDQPLWRNETLLKVRQDPARFLNMVNSDAKIEEARRLSLIFEAAERNIIMYSMGSWIWGGKKDSPILGIPSGMASEKEEYLCNWTFTKAQGKIAWKEIEAQLNHDPIDEKAVASGELTRQEVNRVNNTSYEELFDMIKSHNIVKWNKDAQAYQYLADGELPYDIGKSRKAVVTRMKDNLEWFEEIKRRLVMIDRKS